MGGRQLLILSRSPRLGVGGAIGVRDHAGTASHAGSHVRGPYSKARLPPRLAVKPFGVAGLAWCRLRSGRGSSRRRHRTLHPWDEALL